MLYFIWIVNMPAINVFFCFLSIFLLFKYFFKRKEDIAFFKLIFNYRLSERFYVTSSIISIMSCQKERRK